MKTSHFRSLAMALCLCFTIFAAKAQYVAIPDTNFGSWLHNNGYFACASGSNASGWTLDTTCSIVINATSISCNSANIHDLTGIRYFKHLVTLAANHNYLNTLPVLPATIKSIDCSFNQFTVLPILPSSLISLICSSNQLPALPALPLSLQTLLCRSNQLSSLPALPNSLSTLDCSFNQIAALPALPSSLTSIQCNFNQLISLPSLPASLSNLYCNSNQLATLPILPSSLGLINCDSNRLISLPALPTALYELHCASNQLTGLPAIPANIQYLYCQNNSDLSCLPYIQAYLNGLGISGTAITCLPNRVRSLTSDVNLYNLPLCIVGSGCEFHYNIEGRIHQDTTATCVADSTHPGNLMSNIHVMLLQNGQIVQQCYTTAAGDYAFTTDSLVGYTVTLDTTGLPFTVSCPSSHSRYVPLSATDTVASGVDFGLQCTTPDYSINAIWAGTIKPGDTTSINVIAGDQQLFWYNGSCGSGRTGTVRIVLSGPVHYAGVAAGAVVPTSISGDTILYSISNLDSLAISSLYVQVYTDTTATIGAAVCISAAIILSSPDANIQDDTLSQCFTVVSSYDPNHKTSTPSIVSEGGDWLIYTVDFQNTGTSSATTVVVKDTLSPMVQPETFRYIASDHSAVVQVSGSAVTFTFLHINLPDSGTSQSQSKGWLQYKVRAKPNLPLLTQIKNTAYIYFDYNSAIVTNTTINTVDTPRVYTCSDTTIMLTHAICQGDTFAFGGHRLTISGTYSDTLIAIGGCDSIIMVHLTVNQTIYDTTNQNICLGSTYTFGSQVLTQPGFYNDTLQAVGGCDSIVILHLKVNTLPVITWQQSDSVILYFCGSLIHQVHLDALPGGGHYAGQYIVADTLAPPYQHNNIDSIFSISYNYTDSNGCSSSKVRDIMISNECEGISEATNDSHIILYPNPNTGVFTLVTADCVNSQYKISDMLGNTIVQQTVMADLLVINLSELATGLYTITIKGVPPLRFVVLK